MAKLKQRNAFFLEFIVVILFFSLSAAVILQLFVSANNSSMLSYEKDMALIRAQSVCEEIRAAGLDFSERLETMEGCRLQSGGETQGQYVIFYDKDWKATQAHSLYRMTVDYCLQREKAGTMVTASVSISKQETEAPQELAQLNISHYVSG